MLKDSELENIVLSFRKCIQRDPQKIYGADYEKYAERRRHFPPQPGFVGRKYEKKRLLFVLQNPAVGGGDEILDHEKGILVALKKFKAKPDTKNFVSLMDAMSGPMESSWYRTRVIKRILKSFNLNLQFLAYKNVLTIPLYRQNEKSSSGNRITKNVIIRMALYSMRHHGIDQICALKPKLIICIGYLTYEILQLSMPGLWEKPNIIAPPIKVKGIATPRQEIEKAVFSIEKLK